MNGEIFGRERRHMLAATGYSGQRATAAALQAQKAMAMAALPALEKNPTDPALRQSAIRERERLASLYRQLTGSELFDRDMEIRSGSSR